MQYTLWSRGRLLGSTELGYRFKPYRSRMGDFLPTAAGEKLMPIATGLGPALMRLARMSRGVDEPASGRMPSGGKLLDRLRRTTEYADYAAAEAQSEGLNLQLRGPDGSLIATEGIAIRDMHGPLALEEDPCDDDWSSEDFGAFDTEPDAALEKAIEADRALLDAMHETFDASQEWEESPQDDLPRYQIHVHLMDKTSLP